MHTCAIIVAAGKSRRMGFDKLQAPLAGKTVLQHSINTFASCTSIHSLIVVCDPERFNSLDLQHITKPISRANGGPERHHSVWNGIQTAPPEASLLAVHDGARPLISHNAIQTTILAAQTHHAAALARPATETIKRANAQGFSSSNVSREHLWFMETPQIFSRELLTTAYQHILTNHILVTDEVSALETIQHPTFLVPNTQPNPKITHPADLILAEALLLHQKNPHEIP